MILIGGAPARDSHVDGRALSRAFYFRRYGRVHESFVDGELRIELCLVICYKTSHVTVRNAMKHSLPPLGDLEHEILTLLWKHGELTAFVARQQLARKLKDPTIRTVLRRLEDKGYVTHIVVSGTFIYRPKVSAETTAATAVQNIVERFCGGSIERALVGLVEAGMIDSNQLALIAGKLKRKSR